MRGTAGHGTEPTWAFPRLNWALPSLPVDSGGLACLGSLDRSRGVGRVQEPRRGASPGTKGNRLTVAAVVVSYNRRDLLRRCLSAIDQQVPTVDEIIVVDNGSTDGSLELVRKDFPQATLFETGANVGGAGGFAWGVELAIAKGHDYAWLMDDDAEPAPDSFAPLLKVVENADSAPGFLASIVKDEEGVELNQGHLAVVDPNAEHQLAARALGCLAVTQATFVGVLVNLKLAATMPLPHRDFFIWFDDAEYTRRLARNSLGFCVPESVVRHPAKPANPDMAGRLFYYVRNNLWLTKLSDVPAGVTGSIAWNAAYLFLYALRLYPTAKSKKIWAASLARGLRDGLLRSPENIMPGGLIRESGRTS
ncbi:glycosyltransferase family 2 protein [Sinomonas terrae]|uniref:Glycosyltransferase family 2 protein n=1 Tax=Sinomonas terrae TaxID=2908838 RepID=A0ABS9TZ04_9MICC|nr:glycosyltransferase family 2 protein [Sinomonas terrae]MCH6469671.1 glycosyltransferase family 2 protein [Sinomonas terrae]